MALHAESSNYSPPNKDLKQIYKTTCMDGHNSDDEDGETDPIILRAKAMALAAQNGQKLTPEQMQLIAQPDVQQQKLIEEAKRAQKAKELQLSQQKWVEFQQIGADFTKFIQTEKEKPPLQWGADLGKFIESQSQKLSHQSTHGQVHVQGAENSLVEGDGNEEKSNYALGSSPVPSPRKKMEGFGSDPLPSPEGAPQSLVKGLWPNMTMPAIPMLNESITNILPGAMKGEGLTTNADAIGLEDPVCISAILWKRRSGFGKLSTTKAWEKRRVELRGSKLIYYRTAEEKDDEDRAGHKAAVGKNSEYSSRPTTPNRRPDDADGETDEEEKSSTSSLVDSTPISSSQRIGMMLGQAAQAAEQRIETAKKEFTRMASSGLESLKPVPAETPRGIMDILKENAVVSASLGHSSAPTPFCLMIMAKSEIKWEFAFASHITMMKWLSALTDVVVKASVHAAATKKDGWEMDEYCIQRRGGESDNHEESEVIVASSTAKAAAASTAQRSVKKTAVSGIGQNQWSISGMNLYIAWASANIALILARCSSTTIDQYWKIVVFTNVGLWKLCSRPLRPNESGATDTARMPEYTSTPAKKGLYKPMAGTTAVQVSKVEDPDVNNGHRLPTWVSISSNCLDVRSHGYLTTKKKIPSPGELYECVAVDCFVSNARVPEIAPRVKFGQEFNSHSMGKTWKSPDIFIVSISVPTEAPNFGKSSDDGPGATVVGYFKMKEETRTILRRITAAGYDPSADSSEAEIDVQKRVTNGVRLWERYCQEAPSDPSFQARFKLIPLGNLEELGCPGYISKYNGKPVLIKRNQVTGFFNDFPSLNCMEFDISLHPFPYLFKQGMAYMKDYYNRTVWTFGFVIEGRSNDELPEVAIGALKVCHPNLKFIADGDDLFEGLCAKTLQA